MLVREKGKSGSKSVTYCNIVIASIIYLNNTK